MVVVTLARVSKPHIVAAHTHMKDHGTTIHSDVKDHSSPHAVAHTYMNYQNLWAKNLTPFVADKNTLLTDLLHFCPYHQQALVDHHVRGYRCEHCPHTFHHHHHHHLYLLIPIMILW